MSETYKANWNYPTAVRFGVGRISELAEICLAAGIHRPLLVTDRGLAETPMVQKAVAANEAAGVPTGLFTDVQPNPIWPNVAAGLEAYKSGNHDGVVGFGGGSPLDVAKSIAFMVPQTRPIWDFEDIGDNFKRANSEGIPPIVQIPTTAGTGSEVGRSAVITDEATHTKRIIFHPKMLAAVALLDPELTVGMSPAMTAGTGMDALSHNLEAYCAPGFHPLADGIGAEGVRLVKEYLPTAYKDGANIEARAQMLAAAAMGATAFQKGLGAVHSLSHPVGAIYGSHHGLTNAVFLPYVLKFNRPAIEERIVRLAAYIGLADATFDGFLDWIINLRAEIGIPNSAAELGVEEHRLEEMAEMAADDPTAASNPVKVSTAELLALYRLAYLG